MYSYIIHQICYSEHKRPDKKRNAIFKRLLWLPTYVGLHICMYFYLYECILKGTLKIWQSCYDFKWDSDYPQNCQQLGKVHVKLQERKENVNKYHKRKATCAKKNSKLEQLIYKLKYPYVCVCFF